MKFTVLTILSICLVFTTAQELNHIKWFKNIGGNNEDGVEALEFLNDNVITVGYTYSDFSSEINSGYEDAWITSINSEGKINWQKIFKSTKGARFLDVIITPQKEILAIGYAQESGSQFGINNGLEDFLIVKLSEFGDLIKVVQVGTPFTDKAETVEVDLEGNIYVGGFSNSSVNLLGESKGQLDGLLLKMDADLSLIWSKVLGGSDTDNIADITANADNNIVVTLNSTSIDGDIDYAIGNEDIHLIEINGEGNVLNTFTLGSTGKDLGTDLIYHFEKNKYYLLSESNSDNNSRESEMGGQDNWLVSLDRDFNIEWEISLGGSGYDISEDIEFMKNGILVSATSRSEEITQSTALQADGVLYFVNYSGELEHTRVMNGTKWESFKNIVVNADDKIIGSVNSKSDDEFFTHNKGDLDAWIVTFDLGSLFESEVNVELYPNPVASKLFIQSDYINDMIDLTLYNQQGQLLKHIQVGSSFSELDVTLLSSGIYFLTVKTENGITTEKFIKK